MQQKKYKLIKLLPFENSPRIGYISKPHITQNDNTHYCNGMWFKPENYPEFWEEVIEKDYEILSYYENKNIFTIEDNSEILERLDFKINSIRRLSDGEIFTIGDKVDHLPTTNLPVYKNVEITSFIISGEKIEVYGKYNSCMSGYIYLEFLSKCKTPLFTTEQVKEIENIIKNIIK
jgi:hypothetical protein